MSGVPSSNKHCRSQDVSWMAHYPNYRAITETLVVWFCFRSQALNERCQLRHKLRQRLKIYLMINYCKSIKDANEIFQFLLLVLLTSTNGPIVIQCKYHLPKTNFRLIWKSENIFYTSTTFQSSKQRLHDDANNITIFEASSTIN